jgi:hypothetical protein
MKQHFHLARGEQIVGRAFIGRGIVSLRLGLAEDQMRFVEPAERVDPRQQIIGDAVHDLANVAMHIAVQAAEIGHARGGAHTAEKAVTFDQKRLAPKSAGRGDAGGPPPKTTISNSPKICVSRVGSVMLDKTALPRACSSEHDLFRKPVSTFRDHAPAAL